MPSSATQQKPHLAMQKVWLLLSSSLGAVLFSACLTQNYIPSRNESSTFIPSIQQQQQQHDNKAVRYYIYPEDSISGRMTAMTHVLMAGKDTRPVKNGRLALSELAVHEALERHELRTMDPTEATFFIIPTQVSTIMSCGCYRTGQNCTEYDDVFDALTSHPLFINDDHGKHHILVSLNYLAFTQKHARNYTTPLSRNYPRLGNIIVANRFDPFETYKIYNEGRAIGHDFEGFFPKEGPLVTRAGFSVGSGLETYIPLVAASMERFHSSQYFVFYQTRKRGKYGDFHYQSDRYRHAPLTIADKLQPSSIGYGLPKDEWLAQFSSSQFCLVIRGDTPESHAFFHAIRNGCIPVVISDFFVDFAGPFKSTLDMRDFSIILKEQDFIQNPLESLQGLKNMTVGVIQKKVQALERAQRVIFPDHPQSEFVPAFLKEAVNALRIADEMKTDTLLPY